MIAKYCVIASFIISGAGVQAASLFAPSDSQLGEIRELHRVSGVTNGTAETLSNEQEVQKWINALIAHRTCWLIEEDIDLPYEREAASVMVCVQELFEIEKSISLNDEKIEKAITQKLAEIARGDSKFAFVAQNLLDRRRIAE